MSEQANIATDGAGWIEWKGGECPVEAGDLVDVRFNGPLWREGGSGPSEVLRARADEYDWGRDDADPYLIAYRLSDRLADERSASKSPNSLDPSAIAVARERLGRTAWPVKDSGHPGASEATIADLRTLLADHARLEAENEELRLAICGGEDAPGYAAAQTLETILNVLEGNYAHWRYEAERAMALEDGLRVCLGHLTGGMDGDWRNTDPVELARSLLTNREGQDNG